MSLNWNERERIIRHLKLIVVSTTDEFEFKRKLRRLINEIERTEHIRRKLVK